MLSNEQRMQLIEEKLTVALAPSFLEVEDESHFHIGHAGAQSGAGHFAVTISSEALAGKSKVAAHRLIYQALPNLIPDEIHALRIVIKD